MGDGVGGLLVVYSDIRVGDRDLYATRLGPAGTPGGVTVGVPWLDRVAGPALPGFPNPARGVQAVRFPHPLPAGSRVEVVDASGRVRLARALVTGAASWSWDGRDDRGAPLAPGVYLVRVASGEAIDVARLVRIH